MVMGTVSVTGECITEVARELVVSDHWEKALRFLDEALHCGILVATDISSGLIKLVGEGHCVETAPEDPNVRKKHHEEVLHTYKGRFERSIGGGKTWLRPIACVTNFSETDSRNATMWRNTDDFRGYNQGPNRASFYCERQEEWAVGRAFVPSQKRSCAVIAEMCPSAPSWLPRLCLQEAVAQYESYSSEGLEERGSMQFEQKWGHLHRRIPVAGGPLDCMLRSDVSRQSSESETLYPEEVLDSSEKSRRFKYLREEILHRQETGGYQPWNELLNSQETGGHQPWYTFEAKFEGKTISVPQLAFFHWALQDTPKQPAYQALAASGMRLLNDVPSHTDWMCGAVVEGELDFLPWEHFSKLTEIGYRERYRVHERVAF